jgi:hypothetical protein
MLYWNFPAIPLQIECTNALMKAQKFNFIAITANVQIVQESEKAVKVSTLSDSFGGRSASEKEFWFPKSVVKMQDDKMFVASWFAMKCFQENKGLPFLTKYCSLAENLYT